MNWSLARCSSSSLTSWLRMRRISSSIRPMALTVAPDLVWAPAEKTPGTL